MVLVKKETLRKEARLKRNRLTPGPKCEKAVVDLFFKYIKPQKGQIISAYWPKSSEFDPRPILEKLLKKGFCCALPVTEKGVRMMRFAKWDKKTEMREACFGILEPVVQSDDDYVDPDIVISPLLSFDKQGFRLGYGGGNYDATLEGLKERKDITLVGVAYEEQRCPFNIPHEPHDIPCDWVLTPQKAHKFVKREQGE